MYDTNKKRVQIFITGSNSNLLSSEYSSALSGTIVELTIHLFTFTEILELLNTNKNNNVEPILNNYLEWGGLPEVWLQKESFIKNSYTSSFITKVIGDDIVKRFSIRNPLLLK